MARKASSQLPTPAAASRPLALPSALEEQSLVLIEETLGGRDALVAALLHAPKSRDLEYILGLIGDPANARTPLGHLCAQGGVTPGELLSAWKSGEILRGHVLATKLAVAAIPKVVGDIVLRAAPYEDTCTGCQGVGQVTPEPTKKVPNPAPETCPACRGAGRLLYDADLDRARMVLDLVQLTPKSGGVNVLVDNRQAHLHGGGGGNAAGGTLEAIMAASDQILYGDGLAQGPGVPDTPGLPTATPLPTATIGAVPNPTPLPPPGTRPAAPEVVDGEVLPGADSDGAGGNLGPGA